MHTIKAVPVIAVALLAFLIQEAMAIPAFARKYDMSCTTCHAPFPKLKPFGDEFARNGYRLSQEPPRAYRETGDEKLLLMRELPVAIRFEGYVNYQANGGQQTDFQAPFIMKLLSSGQIAHDVGYYFYFLMTEGGEIVGPEDAFLYFNNLFGVDFDISIGQFQVCDPLFKRELRLTREDYAIYSLQVGDSRASLTYDRGMMVSYGFPTKTDVVLEILNGSGIGGPAGSGFLDNDKNKNFALRLSQEIMANLRIGAFAYMGKESQNGFTNATSILGPDLTASFGPLELNAQYLHREDDNPSFAKTAARVTLDGAFGELIYSPAGDKSDWFGVFLYNWLRSVTPGMSYQSATVNGNYMLARNLRLVGEYTHDLEHNVSRVSLGFVSAF